MRIGLIGCGNIGVNAHIPAVAANDGMTIVAAADPTPERLTAAGAVAGIDPGELYDDWGDLLARDDVEAVIVATPQRFRPDIVIAAVEAGKHVLAEKPLALTPAAARVTVDAARKRDVVLGTVHNYHFMPVYQDIKDVLESGEIGAPEIAVMNYLGVEDRPGAAAYVPRWRHDSTASGGGVLTDMLHVVYLAHWFMGGPPEAVTAWVDRRLDGEGDVEDIALVRYDYPNGHALVNMAWGVGPGGVEIGGDKGRLIMETKGYGTHPFVPAERLHVVGPSGERSWRPSEPVAYGLVGVLADFRDAVMNGRQPVADGEAGMVVLDSVLGAYVAGALGSTVTLPLPSGHPVHAKGAAGIADLDLPASSPVARRRLFAAGSHPGPEASASAREAAPSGG
jgi:predicted dehydrogenase